MGRGREARRDRLVQAGGARAVLDRYTREFEGAETLEGADEEALWEKVRDFTPRFLAEQAGGAVVRVSCTLTELGSVIDEMNVPVVARAGSGVCYGYFADCESAASWVDGAANRGRRAVLEFVPAGGCPAGIQWPNADTDFVIMERIKQMFDPDRLLNRGRLYGRL